MNATDDDIKIGGGTTVGEIFGLEEDVIPLAEEDEKKIEKDCISKLKINEDIDLSSNSKLIDLCERYKDVFNKTTLTTEGLL